MCINYETVSRQLAFDFFETSFFDGEDWRDELYQDYEGPIIVHDEHGGRMGLVGSYGMIPKRHLPPGQRLTTMNARAETVGQLRTYKTAWQTSRLCLVPMRAFFEPNWEQGHHVKWRIGMQDQSPFAVAGLYRTWQEEGGLMSTSFTQLTINADDHPLMRRLHKPGEEKRSLVIIPAGEYDAWLGCRDPELARTFLQPFDAKLMHGEPAAPVSAPAQASLF